MTRYFKFLPLLIFVAFSAPLSAQREGQGLVDSLETVLKQKRLTDKEKVDVFNALSYEYRNLQPEKAVTMAKQAETLATRIHYNTKLGEIYLNLCYSYAFYNDLIKSYEYALLAVKYNNQYKVYDVLPISRLMALNMNLTISPEDKYREELATIPELAKIKDKVWYIRTLGFLGVAIRDKDIKRADSFVRTALQLSINYKQKFMEVHNRARLGTIQATAGNLDSSIALFKHCLAYLSSIQEKRVFSELTRDMAAHYAVKSEQNKIYADSAYKYAHMSLQNARRIGYLKTVVADYFSLYKIHKIKGFKDSAIYYLEQYTALNDTLFGQRARTNIEKIAIQQRDEIAAAQLKVKDSEMARQRTWLYALLSGIGLVSLLFYLAFRNFRNEKKANQIISEEKQRSEDLLLNILPYEVAEELKSKGSAEAKHFDEVTVLFTDFKNFTQISEQMEPAELVDELNTFFKAFDQISTEFNVEKIKTIGDSYMCVGGLPSPSPYHAENVVNAALKIQEFVQAHSEERIRKGKEPLDVRIGIHSGPVVAGIVGIKKYAYDIWGDTVNTASRMESSGEAGKVNISETTYLLVKDKFRCTPRGKILAKHKGEMEMYFVEGKI
ncbi:MAG: adenylate/guanylate cyclase domain-containing protein [Bacteroidetes bacterium]|nr:adenylate/guanylate cyclase domain-containing protein [Bacteroidota bacterium]